MEQHPNLEIKTRLMNDRLALDGETRLILFRIFQEALNNAIQHAQCNQVSIIFEWDAEHILLVIKDDGKGFTNRDFFEWSRQGHFGLLGISERARTIGATLNIQTGPDLGTDLKVLVPRASTSQ